MPDNNSHRQIIRTKGLRKSAYFPVRFLPAAVLLSLLLCSCPDPRPESINLDAYNLEILVNESRTIQASIRPAGSEFTGISWQSGNPGIARVDQQGTVTGLVPGETEITATLEDASNIRAVCQVRVLPSASQLNVALTRNAELIAEAPPEMISWYYFPAATGTTYQLEWQAGGTGGYTADVLVSAYHADKTSPFFENKPTGPREILATACERVYLKVEQLQYGSYSLKYDLQNPATPTTWTLMFYLNSNDLELAVADNLHDMLSGLHPQLGINLIVLLDKQSEADYGIPNLGFTGTRMFTPGPGGLSRIGGSPEFPEVSPEGEEELNLGDAAVLSRFILYSKANFPATSYALILMGHGLGAGGFSADDLTGDRLHPGELGSLLTDAHSVDLLGFNSCLMGNVETAYQFRDDPSNPGFKARWMLAPPTVTREIGWAYAPVLARINTESGGSTTGEVETVTGGTESIYAPASMTAEELGLLFVEEHRDFMYDYGTVYGDLDTLVLYDLGAVTAVKDTFDELAVSLAGSNEQAAAETLRDNPDAMIPYFSTSVPAAELVREKTNYPYYDLMGFCEGISLDPAHFTATSRDKAGEVITAINNMILWAYFGPYNSTTHNYGLSFFFPTGDGLYQEEPMFTYQWWYNAGQVTHIASGEQYFGALDWCADKATDGTGQVDNWFELLDAWYDPAGNGADGGVNAYQY